MLDKPAVCCHDTRTVSSRDALQNTVSMESTQITIRYALHCRELFEMGVRCFDVDVVITADQHLLITHPRALQVMKCLCESNQPCMHHFAACKCEMKPNVVIQDTLQSGAMSQHSQKSIHRYSLQELRLAGGNSTAFPSAAEV